MAGKITAIALSIAMIAGCTSDRSPMSPLKSAETIGSPPATLEDPGAAIKGCVNEAESVPADPASAWDELAAKYPDDATSYVSGPMLPEGPDLIRFYMDGLNHPNTYVQWYAANRIVEYDGHPRLSEAVEALLALAESEQEVVAAGARFALRVFERDFDGEPFVRSLDGRFVAFHLFREARYNDGRIWLADTERDAVYPLKGERPSLERYVWSPDGRALAVEYGGRIWGAVDLVDPLTGDSLLRTTVHEFLLRNQLYTADKQQRPDPYDRFIAWSPDGSRAALSYEFTDDEGAVQRGILVYRLDKSAFSRVESLPPGEDPYMGVGLPEHFEW